jgi:hypothetical protein
VIEGTPAEVALEQGEVARQAARARNSPEAKTNGSEGEQKPVETTEVDEDKPRRAARAVRAAPAPRRAKARREGRGTAGSEMAEAANS